MGTFLFWQPGGRPAGWGNSDRVKSGHLNQNKHLFLHGFGTVDLIEWLAGRYSESLYQRNYSLLFISALTLLLPCLPPPSLFNCRSPKAKKKKMLEDAAQASRRAAAIDAIKKKNWSVRKAAKQFGIPKTTLQDCLAAFDAGRPLLPSRGAPTALPPVVEKELAARLRDCATWGVGVHPSKVPYYAQMIAEAL